MAKDKGKQSRGAREAGRDVRNKEGSRGDPAERVNLSKTSEVRECTTRMSRGEGFQAEATARAKPPGRIAGGEAKKQRVGDLCKVAPT